MPDWLLSGIDNILKMFGIGYNIYTNKRDYEYQSNLQNHLEEREDNAVQRRVADLKAAGLNPNLAAGSAANAGPVVSRSSTNDLNIGSMLDAVMAAKQIKNQEQQTINAKKESEILDLQKLIYKTKENNDKINYQANVANTLASLGVPVEISTDSANNLFDIYVPEHGKRYIPYSRKNAEKNYDILSQNYEIGEYTKDITETDAEWATAGKVGKFLEMLIRLLK